MILPPDFTNILNKFEESIDNRLIKNSPIDLPNNVTIKSFKFKRGGFFGNTQIFEYKTLKNKNILTYNEKGCFAVNPKYTPVVTTSVNFDKQVLKMIKYFHEKFGTNPYICDGEWYEFRATLSNGQKLKSEGYNYFPKTYYRFIDYLEQLVINQNLEYE